MYFNVNLELLTKSINSAFVGVLTAYNYTELIIGLHFTKLRLLTVIMCCE